METIQLIEYTINESGDIEGKFAAKNIGLNASWLRDIIDIQGEDEFYKDEILPQYGTIDITGFKISDLSDISKPLMVSFNFKSEGYAQVTKGKILINPFAIFNEAGNELRTKTRKFPVDFGCPEFDKQIIYIKFPQGYKISTMPEKQIIKLGENNAFYNYSIEISKGRISMMVERKINKKIFLADEYA